jgi:hypothetical protein
MVAPFVRATHASPYGLVPLRLRRTTAQTDDGVLLALDGEFDEPLNPHDGITV